MRILFHDFNLPYLLKDSEYPIGGWTVQLNTWLKGLVQQEQKAGVLCLKGGADLVGESLDFDLLDTYDSAKGIKFIKYFYLYIPAVLRAAKAYKPDIVIQACSGFYTGIMAFISGRLEVPFVYRVANDMDVDERYKARMPLYGQITYRYGLKKAKAILCQNQYQYDHLKKLFPQKPLYILHNPFDTGRKLPKLKPKVEKNYIAWLGVFSTQKNMTLLLKLAENLPSLQFRVAGMPLNTMDKETGVIIEVLKQLKNVTFVGYVRRKEVLEFLGGARVLLSTSHYEGFSNTFLESFAAGTPVVAPFRVDPDQIITKNSLGLTTNNDEEMTQLIKRMWSMETEQYECLCEKCRTYVLVHHELAVKAKELIEILQPLIKQNA